MAKKDSFAAFRDCYDVLTATTTTDSGGGQAVTWATSQVLWGETVTLYGLERLQAGDRTVSDVTHRIKTWRRTDLSPMQRLRSAELTLEIRAVLNASPAYCYLECSEVQS